MATLRCKSYLISIFSVFFFVRNCHEMQLLIKSTVLLLLSFLSVNVGMEEWLPLQRIPFFLIPWHRVIHLTKDKNGNTGSKYCFFCVSISASLTPLYLRQQNSDYTFLSLPTNRKQFSVFGRDYNCTLQDRLT